VRLTARVPATSANLGPGFDALAIALDLCNEVAIETASSARVSWEGEGDSSLPRDGSDLVSAAFRSVFDDAGKEPPTVALHGVNRIPVERGLGSSAAAVVAGVALAFASLDRELEPDAMAPFTDRFESHHDNVAATLRGALTIAYALGDGWSAARLEAHPDLRPVVLVPEVRLSTVLAREALPSVVPLADAAFDAGRSALVVHALTVAPSVLPVALEDRLHQDPRLELLPDVREVFEKLRSDGVPVCVSGAGPSLLAFETPERSVPRPGGSWRTLRLAVRSAGVEVSSG
jgi:homoserine kinase